MKDSFELEKLIEQGLRMDVRDYSGVQSWLETTYMMLAAFPEERRLLELSCFRRSTSLEEKVEQGLEILNAAADRLQYGEPDPLCNINCY